MWISAQIQRTKNARSEAGYVGNLEFYRSTLEMLMVGGGGSNKQLHVALSRDARIFRYIGYPQRYPQTFLRVLRTGE